MDIRVLRYFIAAVEAESITAAAERLHLTQPTLSRQFMTLEQELGHKLFVRSNRKLRLTPKGQVFYERARDIVELCNRTKREMLEEDELAGEIRIAVQPDRSIIESRYRGGDRYEKCDAPDRRRTDRHGHRPPDRVRHEDRDRRQEGRKRTGNLENDERGGI